jgi:hypothetical protein
MELAENIGWALLGGLVAELLGLFEIRRTLPGEWPHWLRSKGYWCITAGMVLAGAVVVLAYERSGMKLSALVAMNVGASAPLALRQLTSVVTRQPSPPNPAKID